MLKLPGHHYQQMTAAVQFCTQMFLSEAALEAVQAGRADFAATLTEIGLLPVSYQAQMQHNRSSLGSQEVHAYDQFCNNARVVKAALCAGQASCSWFQFCKAVWCRLHTVHTAVYTAFRPNQDTASY